MARWRATAPPSTRLHAGAALPGQPVRASRYDAASLPLEAVVERRSVRASGPFDATSSIRLAAESGLHFLRLLDAQETSRSYRRDFIARYALDGAGRRASGPGSMGETLDYWELMAGRVPDGRLLVEDWRTADGQRLPLPAEPAVAAADRAEVNAAIDAWLAYHDSLFSEPADAGDAWQRERMEYAFSIGARREHADRRRVSRRPPRLAQRRCRSGDPARRRAGQRRRRCRAHRDAGPRELSRRARAALLGVRGRAHRLRPAARGAGRPAAPAAVGLRDQLRQRLVRDSHRPGGGHGDAHALARRQRHVRRADAARAARRRQRRQAERVLDVLAGHPAPPAAAGHGSSRGVHPGDPRAQPVLPGAEPAAQRGQRAARRGAVAARRDGQHGLGGRAADARPRRAAARPGAWRPAPQQPPIRPAAARRAIAWPATCPTTGCR